jgi:hypothetical protein
VTNHKTAKALGCCAAYVAYWHENGRSRRAEVTVVLPACRQHKSSERQGSEPRYL